MDAAVVGTDRENRVQPVRLLETTLGAGVVIAISFASLMVPVGAIAGSPPVLDPIQVTGPSCGDGLVPIF